MSEKMMIERDEHGKFAPGNRGGPGRPPAAKETKYLRAMGSVVTVDDWVEITLRAVEDAKDGNYRARDWLSKYIVGPPQVGFDAVMEEHEDPETGQRFRRLAMIARSLTAVMEE